MSMIASWKSELPGRNSSKQLQFAIYFTIRRGPSPSTCHEVYNDLFSRMPFSSCEFSLSMNTLRMRIWWPLLVNRRGDLYIVDQNRRAFRNLAPASPFAPTCLTVLLVKRMYSEGFG